MSDDNDTVASEDQPATFEVGGDISDLYQHLVGNAECNVGWCGGLPRQYPRPHDGCTGLMHANFGDEDYDGDYWLYTKCDVCGESE